MTARVLPSSNSLSAAALSVLALEPTDFPFVAGAYYEQWGRSEDETPAVAQYWTARLFEKATFGRLAWKDSSKTELVGLAIGHVRGNPGLDLPQNWTTSRERRHKALESGGDDALNFLDMLDRVNERMRSEAREKGMVFDAELDFLWVSSKARGLGLSKKLLEHAHSVLRAEGVKLYSLFTDNYCDVGFYRRSPWVKVGEITWSGCEKWDFPETTSFMFARDVP